MLGRRMEAGMGWSEGMVILFRAGLEEFRGIGEIGRRGFYDRWDVEREFFILFYLKGWFEWLLSEWICCNIGLWVVEGFFR